MATAKQLAWRKEFVKRVKAGTLRKKNPTKRKPATKKAAKKVTKSYVNRPSQITKSAPSKRLKTRRAANTVKGRFPNPIPKIGFKFLVQYQHLPTGQWKIVAAFTTKASAVEYGKALAKAYPARPIRVTYP